MAVSLVSAGERRDARLGVWSTLVFFAHPYLQKAGCSLALLSYCPKLHFRNLPARGSSTDEPGLTGVLLGSSVSRRPLPRPSGGIRPLAWPPEVFMWVGTGSKVGSSSKISLLSCSIDWSMSRVGEPREGSVLSSMLVPFTAAVSENLGLHGLAGGGRCVSWGCKLGPPLCIVALLLPPCAGVM